ncbi:ABC transporter ATP-binding protein [Salipiger sp. PrR002]|uniref:ABC transporter ATP-binding protein n=1 Tax=Salipiger sp. PrR002 TaxID=2706489 RepID=UPI0013BADF54|nr:ABC transporter ATP-binding protein [Salipiger sp. PrR002]NDW01760.1 ABC transporter ATP-binding protein [Salipiger sp. PrR002]NDW57803.1 ABC transporter ATP-binding protein [Salipiger sp. PrR004]
MSEQIALEAVNVSRRFPGRGGHVTHALRDVSLRLHAGETLALVGESGSGKSTLARILLGLQQPDEGRVHCFGADLRHWSRMKRAELMQPVFQDPYSSLNPRQSLGRIVAAPLIARGVARETWAPKAAAMLEQVGLAPSWADRRASALSGGQRQRVAIARALIAEPRILVCDEPTSALDVSVQAQILNLLDELKQRLNLTVLMVTHNIGVVAHLADRVAVMNRGQLVETGPAEAVLQNPSDAYTRGLLAAVLPIDPDRARAALDRIAAGP